MSRKKDGVKTIPPNPRKGQKALRGKPLFYNEKKNKHNVNLTNTSWNLLGKLSASVGLSRSEWLERHLRVVGDLNNE